MDTNKLHGVAKIPLQDFELAGLLNGTLKIDPNGPQVPKDCQMFYFCDKPEIDGIMLQGNYAEPGGATSAAFKPTKGIWLGIKSDKLEEKIKDGDLMPTLNVRFVPTNS